MEEKLDRKTRRDFGGREELSRTTKRLRHEGKKDKRGKSLKG